MAVIAGLDPGPERSSIVTWNGVQVLRHLTDENEMIRALIKNIEVADILVIEQVESFGMAVGKETFETVFWSGRFAEAWLNRSFDRIGRKAIKLHLCGTVRATDSNIRQALIDRIGPIGTTKAQGPLFGLKGHEFAALAVAVTYHDQHTQESPF